MRRSMTMLLLAGLIAAVGCGDDEPEEADIPRPVSTRPAPPDTMAAGSGAGVAAADTAAAAARDTMARPAPPTGERGPPAGPTGRAADAGAGDAGGEPAGRGQRLYTIQVAAFTSPDSAQKWTGRLRSMDLPVWMSMSEQDGTTFYRVRVGAVPSFSEARRLGALLSQRLEWPVWVAPVTASDQPPQDAVAATRRMLGGD